MKRLYKGNHGANKMGREAPTTATLTLRSRHVRQQSVCAVVVRRRLFGGDEGVEAVVGGAESSASRESGDSMYERIARHERDSGDSEEH